MTGMISGSSVANVVTTGTFTIPLMKRVGYSPTQSAAIECAAGVNGQLMPPVMGAAAFLMAEYVGISYADVVRHAFLPAIITYGALFYIVDIEAMKKSMTGLPRQRRRSLSQGFSLGLLTFFGLVILAGAFYWGLGWTKTVFGETASTIAFVTVVLGYVALVANRARFPDLPLDDPSKALVAVPDFYEVARTEGILPALETSHAFARGRELARELGAGKHLVINCSGRGDKDVATISARGVPPPTGVKA